ncbi:hypothetical protein BSKO_10194 [Bryopsis sp. KO-2023]|nr:hypothetical protein BSKO_10194 [Bryopsis sp. KO-2023]
MGGFLGGYTVYTVLLAVLFLASVSAGELDRADLEEELFKKKFYLTVVQALLFAACGILAHLYRTILHNNKLHRETVNEHRRLQQEYHQVTCGLQDEIGDLKYVHNEKRDLEKVLKQARGDVLVLRAHLEKSESDRSGLADLVKVYAEEAAKMKSQLSDAQAWQKECVLMDNELNDLHKVSEDKEKKIKRVEEKLEEVEGWETERDELRACIDELYSDFEKQTEELEALKDAKKDAEEWKKRSNTHSKDKLRLIKCAQDQEKKWERYKQKAQLWKDRAQGFEKEKEELEAALEHGAEEYEKLADWSDNACKEGDRLTKELQAKAGEVEKAEEKTASVEKNLEHMKGTFDILVADKTKLQQVVNQQNEAKEELRNALAASQEYCKELEGVVSQKTAQIQEGDNAVAALRRTIQKERGEAAEVEEALEESQRECCKLEDALEGRVEEAHRLKGALVEASEEIQGLEEEVRKKSEAIACLEEMARKKAEEEEMEKENKEIKVQDVQVQTDVVEMHDKAIEAVETPVEQQEIQATEAATQVKINIYVREEKAIERDEEHENAAKKEASESVVEEHEIEGSSAEGVEDDTDGVPSEPEAEIEDAESKRESEVDGAESTSSERALTEPSVENESTAQADEEPFSAQEMLEGVSEGGEVHSNKGNEV